MEEKPENIQNFLGSLESEYYTPMIPDEVTQYYLNRTGFVSPDIKVNRLVGLAAQKFITDIINDSMQQSKIRNEKSKVKDKKVVLRMEDLTETLSNYGITIKKPTHFTENNSPSNQ